MSKVLKLAVIGAVVVAVASLVLPFVAGKRIQEEFMNAAEASSTYPGLSAEVTRYERNFFSSHAKTTVTAQTEKDGEELTFVLNHEIKHGMSLTRPWSARIETVLELPEELREELAEFLDGKPLVTVVSTFALSGDQRHHLSMPAMAVDDSSGSLNWQGLDGVVVISESDNEPDVYMQELNNSLGTTWTLSGKRLKAEIMSDGFEFSGKQSSWRLNGLLMTMDSENWACSGKLGAESLAVDVATQDPAKDLHLRVENASVTQECSGRADTIDSGVTYAADMLRLGDYETSNLTLEIVLEKLSKQAVVNYLDIIVHRTGEVEDMLLDGDGDSQDMARFMASDLAASLRTEVLEPLMEQGPALVLERLEAKTPDGGLSANLRVGLRQGAGLDTFAPQSDVEGDMRMIADYPLAERIAFKFLEAKYRETLGSGSMFSEEEYKQLCRDSAVEVLQNFAQGGIIVREEDTVKAVAEFKDGTLTLNGNQLSGIF